MAVRFTGTADPPGSLSGVVLVDKSASEGVTGVATFGMNESTVTRVYDYDNTAPPTTATHYSIVKKLLGYPTVVTAPSGRTYISRVTPHYINLYKQTNTGAGYFLWAQRVGMKGLAPSGNAFAQDGADYPVYSRYRYEVEYATVPYEVKDDSQIDNSSGEPDESYWQRYISKVCKPAGEFFSLPTSTTTSTGTPPVVTTTYAYKYVTGGTPNVQQSIGKLLAHCNLQVTWHQVPENAVPSMFVNPTLSTRGAIEKTIGCVNHVTFNNYAQGTLLLLGVQMTPHRSPFGNRVFDIVYMMKYFEPVANKGHQFIFRPASDAWLEVTTDGATNLSLLTAGKSIYDWGNFRNLFRPPPGQSPLF